MRPLTETWIIAVPLLISFKNQFCLNSVEYCKLKQKTETENSAEEMVATGTLSEYSGFTSCSKYAKSWNFYCGSTKQKKGIPVEFCWFLILYLAVFRFAR